MTYLTSSGLDRLEAQLSERDRAVIREVARLRLLSGGQLRRLFFAGRQLRSAQRQLRRLVELSVLTRLGRRIGGVRAGSDGAVYELALGGQRLLQRWGRCEGKARARPEPGQRFVAHTLACTDVYVRLVETGRAGALELVQHQAEPEAWRTRVGPYGTPVRLRPDGFVRLGIGERELLWFVEIDQATESLSVIRRQGRAYLAHYEAGVEAVMPRVAWLAPNLRRAELLREALHGLGGIASELFAVAPQADAIILLSGGQS